MTRASRVAIVLAAALLSACAPAKKQPDKAPPTTQPALATTLPAKAELALDQIHPLPVLPPATRPATATTAASTQPSQDAPLDAIALFAEARDALIQGNRYTAIKLLEKAIALDPDSYELRFQLGQANAGPGMGYDAAINPYRVAVQFELGRLNLARGNLPRAIEHLRLAMQTSEYADDNSAAALVDFFLARALQQAGYDRAALDVYGSLIARLQNGRLHTRGVPELAYLVYQPEALFAQVAELRAKRGMFADAVELYRLAAARKPDDFNLQARLVRALIAADRDAEARERATAVVQHFNASPSSLALMKETYQRFGGDEAVTRELQRIHRQRPDDRTIIYALFDTLVDLNRPADAQKLLNDAMQRMRHPPEMVRRLFKLHQSAGDSSAAARLIIETLTARHDATRELLPMWTELLRPWRKNHLTMAGLQALEVPPAAEASKQFWVSQLARVWNRDVLARTSLEQAVKQVPPFPPAYRALLAQYWSRGDWDQAQKRKASEELIESVRRQGADILALHMRGAMMLALDEPREAAKEFAAAREQGDSSADLQLSYATALHAAGDTERARQVLWQLIGDQPSFEDAYVQLFSNYAQAGQAQEVLEVVETWLKNDPTSINAKIVYASVLEHILGRPAQAERLFNELFEREPDNAELLANMRQFYGQSRAGAFIDKLEAKRGEQPENWVVLEHLVSAYASQQRIDDATTALEAARQAAADDPDLLYFIASLYTRIGQKQKTEEVLEQVVALDGEHASACNDLGYHWADDGRNLARAEELIRVAVAREPDSQSFLDSLGWVLYKRADFDQARAALEEAIGTSSLPDPIVLDHLGDTLYQLGQHDQATEQWKRSQERLGQPAPGERDEIQQLRLQLQRKLRQVENGQPVTVAPIADEPDRQAKN